jgi:hypothetical protein
MSVLSMERISPFNQENVRRVVKMVAGLVAFLAAIVTLFHFNRPPEFGVTDFVQYWTASHLLMTGQNPYDRSAVDAVQVGLAMKEHPILMWNPPHIVPMIFWFCVLPFSWAVDLWLVISVILFLTAVMAVFPVPPRVRPVDALIRNKIALIYLFSLYPLFLMLSYGQISALLLASFAGYLVFAFGRNKGLLKDTFIGGIFLGIGTIKPHLLWLPYLLVLYDSICRRSLRTLGGSAGCVAVLYLITFLFFPSILSDYFNAWKESPIYWKTPTVGSWLQGVTEVHQLWVRLLPTILGAIVVTMIFFKKWWNCGVSAGISYELFLGAVPLSLAFSPYGWVYDQLLLVPLGIWMLSRSKWVGCGLIGCNIGMMSMGAIGQEVMVWFPIAYFLLFLICRKLPNQRAGS